MPLVGRIVSFSEQCGKPISQIGLGLLKKYAPSIDAEVYGLFDPVRSVRQKRTIGSTHPDRIKAAIAVWKKAFKGDR